MNDGPQVPQITREVTLLGCILNVQDKADGGRQLQIFDPGSRTVQLINLSPDAARHIGNKLFSAVPVATPGDLKKETGKG